jgi:hypothetical protein
MTNWHTVHCTLQKTNTINWNTVLYRSDTTVILYYTEFCYVLIFTYLSSTSRLHCHLVVDTWNNLFIQEIKTINNYTKNCMHSILIFIFLKICNQFDGSTCSTLIIMNCNSPEVYMLPLLDSIKGLPIFEVTVTLSSKQKSNKIIAALACPASKSKLKVNTLFVLQLLIS